MFVSPGITGFIKVLGFPGLDSYALPTDVSLLQFVHLILDMNTFVLNRQFCTLQIAKYEYHKSVISTHH